MPRGSRLAIDISSDLVFMDEALEGEYRAHHTESQKKLDIQFHYARSLAWAAVGFRMLKDSSAFEHYVAALIVLLGAITTLFPAFAHNWKNKKVYVKYRPVVVLVDNVLQVALGCFTHAHIYPEAATSWRNAAAWRAAGVLMSGSGVAWLNMSSLLGSLIFRFAMAQQATLTIIMLLASPAICTRSFSLQRGYMAVHASMARNASRFLPAFLRSLLPLFNQVQSSAGSKEDAEFALAVCLAYQPLALLSFGLIAPTLYLFWREMNSRKAFARSKARGVPDVLGVSLNPPPSLLQYWAFAAPAVAALYFYVARGL